MISLLLRLSLLLVLLAAPARAWASHLVGGELTYAYLDDKGPAARPFRYQITARVYFNKEPGSSNPNGNTSLNFRIVSKADNSYLFQVAVSRRSFAEITPPVLPGCTLQAPRVTLALYVTTVELPAVSAGYLAILSANARNAGITNLESSQVTGMSLAVDLTPPGLVNSSPVFSTNALSLICRADTSYVVNNAYDADGDRLSYSLATPYQESFPVAPVVYAPGYSDQQPFGATGYVRLDARTGLARYVAQQQGTFLLAIDVREYRTINGREVLLGTTRRDIQVVVRTCAGGPNQPPVFVPPSLARTEYQVVEGQEVSFMVQATDPDNQRLHLTVRSVLLDGAGPIDATVNGQPGDGSDGTPGSVVVSGAGTVRGDWRLRATCGLARSAPYDVVVTVADEACNSKSITAVFRITIGREAGLARVRGDSVLCAQSLGRYVALGPAFGQYRWRVRGGSIEGASTGNTVQVRWGDGPEPGRVTVQGLTGTGCPTDSVGLPVQLRLGPPIAGSAQYCYSANTGLAYTISGPPAAYQWTVEQGTIVRGQGTNTVVVDVVRGATATLRVIDPVAGPCSTALIIRPDDRCLEFFNVITPDGDGRNDAFHIRNLERYPNTELTVYSRWGHVLYHSADYHNDYGSAAPSSGLYYYLCRLADGTVYKGWFEVVR